MILFDQQQEKKERKAIRFEPELWREVEDWAKTNGVDEAEAVRSLVRTALHYADRLAELDP